MAKSYLPTKEADLGQWTTAFAENVALLQASIGITSAQSTALNTANATWVAALAAATAEATRSRPTVQAKNTAKEGILTLVRELVGIIQKHPGTTNEMRAQLGINIRKTPAPAPAPGKPYDFTASLDESGVLTIKWKNTGATGCVYNIYRALDGSTDFVNLGGVGEKKYTDSTIPAGSTRVDYQIMAVRSTGMSNWALFTVKFGYQPGTQAVTQGTPVKIAA